jgi:hypothetical protein
MTTDYAQMVAEDARLVILRALHDETSNTLNEALLQRTLETFGINRSRQFVRTQMTKLEELGGVHITRAANVLIARLTQAGFDHVARRAFIDGVARPSLES